MMLLATDIVIMDSLSGGVLGISYFAEHCAWIWYSFVRMRRVLQWISVLYRAKRV